MLVSFFESCLQVQGKWEESIFWYTYIAFETSFCPGGSSPALRLCGVLHLFYVISLSVHTGSRRFSILVVWKEYYRFWMRSLMHPYRAAMMVGCKPCSAIASAITIRMHACAKETALVWLDPSPGNICGCAEGSKNCNRHDYTRCKSMASGCEGDDVGSGFLGRG